MPALCLVPLAVLVLALPVQAQPQAQPLVTGRVTDAETGAPLPAATVQVAGTYTGTITNADGEYELRLPAGTAAAPAELVVRFIGYETARRTVPEGPATARVDVALEPAAIVGPELVVRPGGEDPAVGIMREVIRRKGRWKAGLQSWQADAYGRKVLGRDTAVTAVIESVTEAFWKEGEGVREVVRAVRRTENLRAELGEAEALGAADAVVNLYDDEVRFGGYRLMGPTHPGALGFYRFTLEGTRTLDGAVVYDIALRPQSGLQPGFEGRVAVLDGAFALLEAELRPNEVVRFPLVTSLELAFGQQFSAFGREGEEAVWLPVDYRFEAAAEVGVPGLRFPRFTYRGLVRLSDYRINAPVPDSLFAPDGARTARLDTTAAADSLLTAGVVPLAPDEADAYARLDSTDTLEEAYRPSGPLARFVDFEGDEDEASARGGFNVGGVRPAVWYNRVEAAHLGLRTTVPLAKQVALRLGAGYSTGLEAVTAEGALTAEVGPVELTVGGRREHAVTTPHSLYGRLLPSAAALAGEPDYFDYYRRTGAFAAIGLPARGALAELTLQGRWEDHDALRATTAYDLLGRDGAAVPNLRVPEGSLAALALGARFGDATGGLGADLGGGRGLTLRLEGGRHEAFADPYLRAEGALQWRVPTLLRRRLFPMALDLRLAGGVSAGGLPPQRQFGIDGTVLGVAPSGVLRTRRDRPYAGSRYAALTWSHSFRSVPFELLGLDGLAGQHVGLAVHGGHARVGGGTSGTEGWHHEVGLSLHGGFLLPARLDVTARLDEPAVFVSLGLARLF